MRRLLFLTLVLVAAACSQSNGAETSTTAGGEAGTTAAGDTTTTAPSTTGATATDAPSDVEALLGLPLGTPLPEISRSFDIEVADFNGDGRDDILFTRHQNRKIAPDNPDGLWVATDDGYELLFLLPMMTDRHGCAAGDVNDDGLLDAYCQRGGFKGSGKLKANELWIQTAPGVFEDQAVAWGVDDPAGRGRWPVMLDYDNDGLVDLYVTNEGNRTDDLRSENMLFRNVGGRFEEVVTGATGEVGRRCVNAADFNGDGWIDLTVCDNKGTLVFLQNESGTDFVDVTEEMTGGSKGWKDAAFADLNRDGALDVALIGSSRAQIRMNNGEGTWFTKVNEAVELDSYGWSVAIGDFYGNERLDVYLVQQGTDCTDIETGAANGTDLLLVGPKWNQRRIPNHRIGCGDEVAALDGTKVLVTNGSGKTRGPVQVLDLRDEAP